MGETARPYIVAATRSPLNPKQWFLNLSCGHEKWVTQVNRPPDRKRVHCEFCEYLPGEVAP